MGTDPASSGEVICEIRGQPACLEHQGPCVYSQKNSVQGFATLNLEFPKFGPSGAPRMKKPFGEIG